MPLKLGFFIEKMAGIPLSYKVKQILTDAGHVICLTVCAQSALDFPKTSNLSKFILPHNVEPVLNGLLIAKFVSLANTHPLKF